MSFDPRDVAFLKKNPGKWREFEDVYGALPEDFVKPAPTPGDLDYLNRNPQIAEQFVDVFGSLPEGFEPDTSGAYEAPPPPPAEVLEAGERAAQEYNRWGPGSPASQLPGLHEGMGLIDVPDEERTLPGNAPLRAEKKTEPTIHDPEAAKPPTTREALVDAAGTRQAATSAMGGVSSPWMDAMAGAAEYDRAQEKEASGEPADKEESPLHDVLLNAVTGLPTHAKAIWAGLQAHKAAQHVRMDVHNLDQIAYLAKLEGTDMVSSHVVQQIAAHNGVTEEDVVEKLYEAAINSATSEEEALERSRQLHEELSKHKKKVHTNEESAKYFAGAILEATLIMGPAVAASLLTRNPNAALAVIGTQVYADSYAQQRNDGRTHEQASADAAFYAFSEVVVERIPLGIIMNKGGDKLLKRALKAAAAEGTEEMINEALQIGWDMEILRKDITLGEAITQLKHAGIIGAGVGVNLTVMMHPFVKNNVNPDDAPPGLRAHLKAHQRLHGIVKNVADPAQRASRAELEQAKLEYDQSIEFVERSKTDKDLQKKIRLAELEIYRAQEMVAIAEKSGKNQAEARAELKRASEAFDTMVKMEMTGQAAVEETTERMKEPPESKGETTQRQDETVDAPAVKALNAIAEFGIHAVLEPGTAKKLLADGLVKETPGLGLMILPAGRRMMAAAEKAAAAPAESAEKAKPKAKVPRKKLTLKPEAAVDPVEPQALAAVAVDPILQPEAVEELTSGLTPTAEQTAALETELGKDALSFDARTEQLRAMLAERPAEGTIGKDSRKISNPATRAAIGAAIKAREAVKKQAAAQVKAEQENAAWAKREAKLNERAERQRERDVRAMLDEKAEAEAGDAINLSRFLEKQEAEAAESPSTLAQALKNAYAELEAREKVAVGKLKKFFDKPIQGEMFDVGGALMRGGEAWGRLAEVGALKIAKGLVRFGSWAQEMTDQFGKKVVPILRDLYEDSRKLAHDITNSKGGVAAVSHRRLKSGPNKGEYVSAPPIAKTPRKMGKLRSALKELAVEGEPGKFWYERSGKAILEATGGNVQEATLLAGLIAIYSAGTAVAPNTTNALKAWNQHKAGMPIKAGMYGNQDKAAAEWLRTGEEPTGLKRSNFYFNLMREIDPANFEHGQGATVDRWMIRAFGWLSDAVADSQYIFAQTEVKKIAKALGWEPQQAQAAIWVAIKGRWDTIRTAAKKEALRKGIAEMKPGKDKKPTLVAIGKDDKERAANEKKIVAIHRKLALRVAETEARKAIEVSKADYMDELQKHYGVISWEAQESTTLGRDMALWTLAEKAEFQQMIAGIMTNPETGREYLAEWLGMLGREQFQAVGAWNLDVGVTMQNKLLMPQEHKGKGAAKRVDPSVEKTMNAYAAIVGILLKQDGVAWHRPFYSATKKESNGVQVVLARSMNADETNRFYQAMFNVMQQEFGLSPAEAMYYAPINLDLGFRVLNFNDKVPNAAPGLAPDFHKAVEQAAREVFPFDDFGIEVFNSSGNMPENNWATHKNGEAYEEIIRNSNDPVIADAFERAKRELAPEIEKARKHFEETLRARKQALRELDAPVSMDRVLAGGQDAVVEILSRFGRIEPGTDTNAEMRVYDLGALVKNPAMMQAIADAYGFRVEYFSFESNPETGVEFKLPQLKKKGYKDGYVWLYDPRNSDGSFKGAVEYTRAWRVSHEIAHGVTEQYLEERYGASKRYGRLGRTMQVDRGTEGKQIKVEERALTLTEAQRAVEWEDVAFRAQRMILEQMGVRVDGEAFAQEYNINLADAVYRVLTGEFGNPGDAGFRPSNRRVDIHKALALLEDAEVKLAKEQGRAPTKGIDLKSWTPISDAQIREALDAKRRDGMGQQSFASEAIIKEPRVIFGVSGMTLPRRPRNAVRFRNFRPAETRKHGIKVLKVEPARADGDIAVAREIVVDVPLSKLYNTSKDPKGLRGEGTQAQFEAAIKDSGFTGFYQTDSQGKPVGKVSLFEDALTAGVQSMVALAEAAPAQKKAVKEFSRTVLSQDGKARPDDNYAGAQVVMLPTAEGIHLTTVRPTSKISVAHMAAALEIADRHNLKVTLDPGVYGKATTFPIVRSREFGLLAEFGFRQDTESNQFVRDRAQGATLFSVRAPAEAPKLRTDNPGGEWLAKKIAHAKEQGNRPSGAPESFGTVTGFFQDHATILVPVEKLARVPGIMGEQAAVRQHSLAWLKNHMDTTGRLPEQTDGAEYAPFIQVDSDGKPWVNEGNHRIMAAKALGWTHLPVTVRYFNGGETQTGPFAPETLRQGHERLAKEPRIPSHPRGEPVASVNRGTNFGKGIPLADAENIAAAVRVNMPLINQLADVYAVESWEKLPAAIRGAMKMEFSKRGEVEAVYHDPGYGERPQIILISNNIDSHGDAVTAMLHEVVGHFGVRSILGGGYRHYMATVWHLHEQDARAAAKRNGLPVDHKDPEIRDRARLTAAEEYIAYIAGEIASGNKPPPRVMGVFENIVRAIRLFFARFGMVQVSNNDILFLINSSMRWAKGEAYFYRAAQQAAALRSQKVPLYYSALLNYAESKLPNSATPAQYLEQMKAALKKGQFKQAEWDLLQVEWLLGNPIPLGELEIDNWHPDDLKRVGPDSAEVIVQAAALGSQAQAEVAQVTKLTKEGLMDVLRSRAVEADWEINRRSDSNAGEVAEDLQIGEWYADWHAENTHGLELERPVSPHEIVHLPPTLWPGIDLSESTKSAELWAMQDAVGDSIREPWLTVNARDKDSIAKRIDLMPLPQEVKNVTVDHIWLTQEEAWSSNMAAEVALSYMAEHTGADYSQAFATRLEGRGVRGEKIVIENRPMAFDPHRSSMYAFVDGRQVHATVPYTNNRSNLVIAATLHALMTQGYTSMGSPGGPQISSSFRQYSIKGMSGYQEWLLIDNSGFGAAQRPYDRGHWDRKNAAHMRGGWVRDAQTGEWVFLADEIQSDTGQKYQKKVKKAGPKGDLEKEIRYAVGRARSGISQFFHLEDGTGGAGHLTIDGIDKLQDMARVISAYDAKVDEKGNGPVMTREESAAHRDADELKVALSGVYLNLARLGAVSQDNPAALPERNAGLRAKIDKAMNDPATVAETIEGIISTFKDPTIAGFGMLGPDSPMIHFDAALGVLKGFKGMDYLGAASMWNTHKNLTLIEIRNHIDTAVNAKERAMAGAKDNAPAFWKTEQHQLAAIKKMVQIAVQNGVSRIAFAPGEVHAKRYGAHYTLTAEEVERSRIEIVEMPHEDWAEALAIVRAGGDAARRLDPVAKEALEAMAYHYREILPSAFIHSIDTRRTPAEAIRQAVAESLESSRDEHVAPEKLWPGKKFLAITHRINEHYGKPSTTHAAVAIDESGKPDVRALKALIGTEGAMAAMQEFEHIDPAVGWISFPDGARYSINTQNDSEAAEDFHYFDVAVEAAEADLHNTSDAFAMARGLMGLYNEMLPLTVKKFAKQFGAKVEERQVTRGDTGVNDPDRVASFIEEFGKFDPLDGNQTYMKGAKDRLLFSGAEKDALKIEAMKEQLPKVLTLEINDALKSAVETTGFSLFSIKNGQTGNPLFDSFASKVGPFKPLRTLKHIYQSITHRWKDRAITQGIDIFHGQKVAEEALGIAPDDQGYISMRLAAGSDVVMRMALEYGVPIWKDGATDVDMSAGGFLHALRNLAGNADMMRAWELWMIARRADRLKGDGREKLFDQTEIDEVINMVGQMGWTQTFEDTAAEYAEWKRKLLDFAEEAGVINAESRPLWENADHIPFYRVLEGDVTGPFSGGAIADVKNQITKLRGSDKAIADPMGNIMMNIASLIDASMRNHAARLAITNLDGTGIVTKIKNVEFTSAIVPLEQLRSRLRAVGVSAATLDAASLKGIEKLVALQAPTGENVVSFLENGKRQYYEVHDPLVLTALQGVHPNPWPKLMSLLRGPKRLFTQSITLDPIFMYRNWFRDMVHSSVLGRDGVVIPFLDSARGALASLTKDEDMLRMMATAGAFDSGYVNANDPASMSKMVKNRLSANGFFQNKITGRVRSWVEFYRDLSSSIENANRVALYRKARAAGKTQKMAAYESRDIVDFSMRGAHPLVRFIAETTPFWNARLQGVYRTFRVAGPGQGRRAAAMAVGAVALKGLTLTMATIALFLRNRDDERWKELPTWEKNTYYHFFDVFEDGDHWVFPKPFEIGAMFSTVPEIMMEGMLSKEPDGGKQAANALYHVLAESLNFAPDIQAAMPMAELAMNRDTFRQSNILTDYDRKLLPEDQVDYRSPKTVTALARSMPDAAPAALRSPKQLEHLIRGYTGTLGGYAIDVADMVWWRLNEEEAGLRPTRRADETVGKKAFVRNQPKKYPKQLAAFYEILDDADKVWNSMRLANKADDFEREDFIEDKYLELVIAREEMEPVREEIRTINAEIKEIHTDQKMHPDEKRKLIDELLEERGQLAKEVYEWRPGGPANTEAVKGIRRSMEASDFKGMTKPEQVKALTDLGMPATAELLRSTNLSPREASALVENDDE